MSDDVQNTAPKSPARRLAERLGATFPNIEAASLSTDVTMGRLAGLLRDQDPSDTSIVVFGSLARGEYTSGSDVDWTLLIDGQADEDHYARSRSVGRILESEGFQEPGPTGVFGNVAFSHPILHQIGGQEDTNKNTTQRILLLLESAAVGKREAHERVLRLVLSRYVEDDRGLLYGSKDAGRVPRFLLNDIVRYWRTVTVDFVSKQRERSSGWALRNAKLRMSRKLIFVAGLLLCFSFELSGEREGWPVGRGEVAPARLVARLRDRIRVRPLDSLAEALLRPSVSQETAMLIFKSYDAFLGILTDPDKRGRLKRLSLDDLGSDSIFRDVVHLGRDFQQGLDRLFFEEDEVLRRMIKGYGVF